MAKQPKLDKKGQNRQIGPYCSKMLKKKDKKDHIVQKGQKAAK